MQALPRNWFLEMERRICAIPVVGDFIGCRIVPPFVVMSLAGCGSTEGTDPCRDDTRIGVDAADAVVVVVDKDEFTGGPHQDVAAK